MPQDMNAFWATYQFCGAAQTQLTISPLPELTTAQADQLVQRLGNPAIVFPRLAVPFSLWGALLTRDDWRQQLYSRRCGIKQAQPAVVQLSAWLQGQFTAGWQAVDTVSLPTQIATAWRSNASATEAIAPEYALSRVQVWELSADLGEIALLLGMTPISDSQINLGLLICPVGENATFVEEIQVRLLDGADAEVGRASATMTETIQFQFSGQVGERFKVELAMGDRTRTETFEI